MLRSRPLSTDGRFAPLNDENAVQQVVGKNNHKTSTSMNKTPGTSKARRAFGDISNRKGTQHTQNGKSGLVNGKTPSRLVVKQQQLFPTTAKKPLFSSKTPFQQTSTKKLPVESSTRLHHQQPKVQFVLPSKVEAKTREQEENLNDDADSVDSIELPAGRTGDQERAYLRDFYRDNNDGDDDHYGYGYYGLEEGEDEYLKLHRQDRERKRDPEYIRQQTIENANAILGTPEEMEAAHERSIAKILAEDNFYPAPRPESVYDIGLDFQDLGISDDFDDLEPLNVSF